MPLTQATGYGSGAQTGGRTESSRPSSLSSLESKDLVSPSPGPRSYTTKGSRVSTPHSGRSQHSEKEHRKVLRKLLRGGLDDLPSPPPTQVRLYICSTNSDMCMEKHWLVKRCYPELRQYCNETLHMELRVIDMRWAESDEVTSDHVLERLCQQELADCRRLSFGPYFIALLGDTYGSRPVPASVDGREFETMYREARMSRLSRTDLLEDWYIKDESTCPPVYTLEPIKSRLEYYGDYTHEDNEESRKKDEVDWNKASDAMKGIFKRAATSLGRKGRIAAERMRFYAASGLEHEIGAGMFAATNPSLTSLCFHRMLKGLDENKLRDDKAAEYIDTIINTGIKVELDTETVARRQELQLKTIPSRLHKDNIIRYHVPWQAGGINPENNRHNEYLNSLGKDLVNGVRRLLEEARLDLDIALLKSSKYHSNFPEILTHLRLCVEKVSTFRGHDDVLDDVRSYLDDEKCRRPLVVYGDSGTGKSHLLAQVAALLPAWYGKDIGLVLRFLGTTPESSDVYDMLMGVITQLSDQYHVPIDSLGYRNMSTLSNYFPKFLRAVGRACSSQVFVIFDGLDQLESTNKAHLLRWLPIVTPVNVHLIVSAQKGEVLENAQYALKERSAFVELGNISEKMARDIIAGFNSYHGRQLTLPQTELIIKHFNKDPNVHYLRVLLDQSLNWTSNVAANIIKVPTSVTDSMHKMFFALEKAFGTVFVSRAIGLLSLGICGLSETELEDALSMDDEVLDEVYVYRDPPVPGVVRFPTLNWVRLKDKLNRLFQETTTHNKTTITWYHKRYTEAARARYGSDENGERHHRHLAELYKTEGNVKRDIHLSKRSLTIPLADRQISPQPMVATNLRKLHSLPYHLLHSGDVDDLKSIALCNLFFMMAKAEGCFHEGLIKDYDMAIGYLPGDKTADLRIIRNALVEMKTSVKSAELLPCELLARLPSHAERSPALALLLQQCRSSLETRSKPTLVPLYPALEDRDMLQGTFKNCSNLLSASYDCEHLLVKGFKDDGSSCKVYYHVTSCREGKFQFLPGKCQSHLVEPVISLGGKFAFTLATWDGGPVENRIGVLSERSALYAKSTKWRTSNCLGPDEEKLNKYNLVCRKLSAVTMEVVKEYRLKIPGFEGKTGRCMQVSSDLKTLAIMYSAKKCTNVAVWDLEENKLLSNYMVGNCEYDIHELVMVPRMNTILCLVSEPELYEESLIHVYYCKPKVSRTIKVSGLLLAARTVLTDDNRSALVAFIRDFEVAVAQVDIVSGKTLEHDVTLKGSDSPITCITHGESPHCCTVTTRRIEVYDIRNQARVLIQDHNISRPSSVAMDDGMELIAVGDDTGHIHLYRYDPPSRIGSLKVGHSEILHVFFAGDWQSVVTWTSAEVLQVWNIPSVIHDLQADDKEQTKPLDLSQHHKAQHAQFIFNGLGVLTADYDARIRYWDMATLGTMREESLPMEMTADDLIMIGKKTLLSLCTKTYRFSMFNEETGRSLTFAKIPDERQLAMTVSLDGCTAFVLAADSEKGYVYEISVPDFKVVKRIVLKEPLLTNLIEIKLTEDERYLAFKITCTVKERELVKLSEERTNMVVSTGPYKFASLDLSNRKGELIVCNRPLTGIPCLGNCWTRLSESKFLIGRETKILVWNLADGTSALEDVESSPIHKYYRPAKVKEGSTPSVCYGRTMCLAVSGEGRETSSPGDLVVAGSEDGWCVPYKANTGEALAVTLADRPSHSSAVELVALSPDNKLAVSCSSSRSLKMFDLTKGGKEVFNLTLNVEVTMIQYSRDGRHVMVLGNRPDGETKIILFQVRNTERSSKSRQHKKVVPVHKASYN